MKIAFIGGHPTPAFAVIDALPKDVEKLFIGRKYMLEGDTNPSFEYTEITKKGIPFIPITTGRIQRNLTRHTIPSLVRVPFGLMQALTILRKERPDVVIGFGGYVSVPVCLAAYMLHIPFVIHEQTLQVGLANKVLSRFATKICLGWPQSSAFFPTGKSIVTGNPIRNFPKSVEKFPVSQEAKPLLFVTGGSTGSHAINVLIEESLEQLLPNYRIIHQTGDAKDFGDYDRLVKVKENLPQSLQKRYHCTKMISAHEFGVYLQGADLVISRAGMNTVTELLSLGKMCFLIPLPYGQRNEQLQNALFVKKAGIGEYVLQKDVTAPQFVRTIDHMLSRKAAYTSNTAQARALVRKDAPERIIKVLYEVAGKK